MNILLLTLKEILTIIVAPIIVQINVELFKRWLRKDNKNNKKSH